MNLHTYMRGLSVPERQKLARDCGTSVGYLAQLAYGYSMPSMSLAARIEDVTAGGVTRRDWPSSAPLKRRDEQRAA
jgi:transcriptional regulator with XRE-family HTH domain